MRWILFGRSSRGGWVVDTIVYYSVVVLEEGGVVDTIVYYSVVVLVADGVVDAVDTIR